MTLARPDSADFSRPVRGPFWRGVLLASSVAAAAAFPGAVPAIADPVQSGQSSGATDGARTRKLPPVIFVSRVFRDVPPAGFEQLTLQTRTVDGDVELTEKTVLKVLERGPIVTKIEEHSTAAFTGESGTQSRTVGAASYVLGGLLLIEGLWTVTEASEGGDGAEVREEGAVIAGMNRVAGTLFPLKVGNRLELRYEVRSGDGGDTTKSDRTYQVVRKVPAKSIAKGLQGHIFVIEGTYNETVGSERYRGRETIYYSQALGWPVGAKRADEGGGTVFETTLAGFTLRAQ